MVKLQVQRFHPQSHGIAYSRLHAQTSHENKDRLGSARRPHRHGTRPVYLGSCTDHRGTVSFRQPVPDRHKNSRNPEQSKNFVNLTHACRLWSPADQRVFGADPSTLSHRSGSRLWQYILVVVPHAVWLGRF